MSEVKQILLILSLFAAVLSCAADAPPDTTSPDQHGADTDAADTRDTGQARDARTTDASVTDTEEGDGQLQDAQTDTSNTADTRDIRDTAQTQDAQADTGPADTEPPDLPPDTVDRCTSDESCEDGSLCTTWSCVNGACIASPTPDRCLIEAACLPAGTLDPADACQLCLPGQSTSAWTLDPSNPTCHDALGYWGTTTRSMATTPRGHVAAIACHNCYHQPSNTDSPSTSLTRTLTQVHNALAAGADLIELDITYPSGTLRVDHNDTGATNGAALTSVLADPTLKNADALLFIESKVNAPTEIFIRDLLNALRTEGYATANRPVILRTFNGPRRAALEFARRLLATEAFADMRPHIRLNELFSGNQGGAIANAQMLIAQTQRSGFHGVEFHYQDRDLFGKLSYAQSLGLGVNLYTIPNSLGEVFVANIREDVDAITVDYPVAAARAVVEEDNMLLYMNLGAQTGSDQTITYFRDGPAPYTLSINGGPEFELLGVGEDRFGGSLVFNAAARNALTFYDADNSPDVGYFVTTVVNFDDLNIADGDTAAILTKADNAGFVLELTNPAGAAPTVLRFGVFVGGRYHYATTSASTLNDTSAYFITGAYDGNGGVWLWINNSHDGVTNGSASGGVVQNDSPVVLGADPQGATARRYFFSGRVAQIMVLSWGAH